jgi:hypothetical protein
VEKKKHNIPVPGDLSATTVILNQAILRIHSGKGSLEILRGEAE